MPKNTQFHGILAVGRTKADAVNNYRLLAMGKGATVQVDEAKNLAFVTHASHADGMFNPMSGNMDLGTDTTYMKQLEFASHSSGELEVNHLVCTSGCGAHVVFDSESLVKYCPHCTSSLSEDSSEEESEEDAPEDEESEDAPEDDSDLEDGSDEEESEEDAPEEEESDEGSDEGSDEEESEEDAPEEEESDEDKPADKDKNHAAAEEDEITLPEYGEDDGDVSISSEDGLCVAADSLKQASALFVKNLPTKIKSISASIESHYVVCASSECAAHIVSTEAVAECPACHGKVVEPKAEVKAALSSDGVSCEVEDENLDSPVRKTEAVDVKNSDSAPETKTVEASDDGDCDEDDEECGEENTLDLADSEGNVLNEDTEELDAMDEGEEESESSDLDVSYSSQVAGASRWTAYFKGTPVAIASKSSAGKNADIFDTPSFGHAALATAKVAGIRKALVELGFAPIKHKVSVSKAIRKMVDAQVAESRASISAEQAEYKERFAAALAASAIGLNRGFYADKKNPIKASMWSTLSSAGIRNPESLIDTVFKNHSDAYHKTLFELASDLTSKSAEVQESLSKAIYGMSYQEVSASSEGSLEGRLETFGTSVSSETQTKPQQQEPAGRQQISDAVRSLGRHGR